MSEETIEGGLVGDQSLPVADRRRFPWVEWDDEELLDLKFCDLGVRIAGTELALRIAQLHGELKACRLRFRPHFWLSEEWFSPDGVPGVAIPFYLAHPRLAQLEQNQMLEVEGGTPEWCMRILRHETGHAIDNAYRFRRRHLRQRLFGKSSQRYPEYYTPRPYSRSYVHNLEMWYAQSHPDEDFAETFAVWLTPGSQWRQRYADWPALKKLEYVDELMREIAGVVPPVATRRRVDALHTLRRTLREHYREKRERYGIDYPGYYDRELRRLFSSAPEHASNMSAARFLSGVRKSVRRMVASWTGVYQYTIAQVLDEIVERCRALDLHLKDPPEKTRAEFTVFLTVQTMNYLHSGGHRIAL